MTPQERTAIKERLGRATPWPWEDTETRAGVRVCSTTAEGARGTLKTICNTPTNGKTSNCCMVAKANMEFIAHAPKDIEGLLAENDQLKALKKYARHKGNCLLSGNLRTRVCTCGLKEALANA